MTQDQLSLRLDELAVSRRHWRVILTVSVLVALVVPNVMIIAFALARLLREWSLSPVEVGIANSLAVLGMLGGGLAGGYAADRFGRKPTILVSFVGACTFSALSALAWDLPSFALLRMLAAAGGSSAFATAPPLLAEISPRRVRGRVMIFLEVAWALGASLAGLNSYLAMPAFGWRVAVAFGVLPILAVPFLSRGICESPRFLVARGRAEEGDRIVRSLEGSTACACSPPTAGAEVSLVALPPRRAALPAFRRVWEAQVRNRTVLLWILWFVVNVTYFGVFTWLPTLMVARGIAEVSSFGWNLYMSFMLAPGAILGGLLADRWGRKATLAGALTANGLATVFFGLTATPLSFLIWGGLFSVSHQAIWVALLAYTNETYPSEMRAQGSSYAAAVGRIGSVFAPFVIGSVIGAVGAEAGYRLSFSLFALLLFAGGGAAVALGVETRGRSLEELA